MQQEHCLYQQSKSPESKKKAGGGGEGGEEEEQEVEEEKVRSTRYTHPASPPQKKQISF